MIKEALAFLKKDFLVEASYKFAFLITIFGVLTTLLSYYFINQLFGSKIVSHLQAFGVNYFAYVLLSMAFFSYIGVGLGSFSNQIRTEQVQGTLETILLSPISIPTVLLAMGLWNLVFAILETAIYIVLGIFLFKIDFTHVNPASALLIFILTITSFSSLGILSASFIMVFKRGNPVSWVINSMEGLIGGVYFPISVLPVWLQFVAKFFPITYAIRAIELAVYKGYSVAQLAHEIGFLFAFSILLLPLSLAAFKYALHKTKKDGSLAQY